MIVRKNVQIRMTLVFWEETFIVFVRFNKEVFLFLALSEHILFIHISTLLRTTFFGAAENKRHEKMTQREKKND